MRKLQNFGKVSGLFLGRRKALLLMRSSIAGVFIFSVCVTGSTLADTVYLKNNKVIQGEILEENPEFIRMDVGQDMVIKFYTDEIDRLVADAERPDKIHSQRAARSLKLNTSRQTEQSSFLWKVESDQTVIYLFGSIHLGKKDMYPLAEVIETAFDQSSHLVVEVNLDAVDPLTIQQKFMMMGMLKKGGTVRRLLSPATFGKLQLRLKEYNMPISNFTSMKPWLISMTLTLFQIKALGFDEEYGVDHYFLSQAEGKKILQLETFEQQLEFLDSIPDQEAFLEYTLASLDETEEVLEELIASWKSGNAEMMEKMMITDLLRENPQMKSIFDIILFKRNVTMTEKIVQFLETKDVYFVVVGAGHLVSEKGIVALLRDKGYDVEQL